MEFKVRQTFGDKKKTKECSRTRLEFKDTCEPSNRRFDENAVAPDWNLKFCNAQVVVEGGVNAVAPDWNLKTEGCIHNELMTLNAVAPDWNLKDYIKLEIPERFEMQSHQIGI